MNSRKDARETLVTALDAITTLAIVYDRLPATLAQNPAAIVTAMGTVNRNDSLGAFHRIQVLSVKLWWERIDATIEDRLDDLSGEVYDVLEADRTLVVTDAASQVVYVTVDGKQYIVERIIVEVW